MALGVIRGAGIGLQVGNYVSLAAGETFTFPPGTFNVAAGPYTFIETLDPILGIFRPVNGLAGVAGSIQIESDGTNYRLANMTGCAVAARVTTVGSGYTSAPVVTTSGTSAATWKAIVGGAISQTVTVTTAGVYAYAPTLIIPPPPAGGVPASAIATISAGVINAVTVINQGAGYVTAPPIIIVPDARDTASAGGGVLTTTLTGSGTITAVVRQNHGIAVTAVPTLTFTGGGGSSAAASVLLCATSTGITFSGPSHGGNGSLVLIPGSGVPPSAGAVINPAIDTGWYLPRMGYGASQTGALTAATIIDGGLGQYWNGVTITPINVYNSDGTISAATTLSTNTFGGVTDTSFITPE